MSSSHRTSSGTMSRPPTSSSSGDNSALLHSMNHLSVSPAPAAVSSRSSTSPVSSLHGTAQKAPATSERRSLHRSPSMMSIDTPRTHSPTLLRKASMNSIRNAGAVTPPRAPPSRASSSRRSSTPLNAYGRTPLSNQKSPRAEKPIVTAEMIAREHFAKELDLHAPGGEDERPAETAVILHDACYGHRFSRPRTSRSGLSTIVERPERVHASVLGISAAYVRLGERHADGRYAVHPKLHPSNYPGIPFCIHKSTRKVDLTSPAVTSVHGAKWMEELKIMCNEAETKLTMNGKELARPAMDRGAGSAPPQEFHQGDLYLCSESLNAMEGALGAVCDGVDTVFNASSSGEGPRRAFVVVRPPGHHCSASYPSGFCWLNNLHVGIAHAAMMHDLTHAAIIDFDLHHGDGSQSIAWGHNSRAKSSPKNAAAWKKSSIGYFSLHDINSYPCEMGDEEKVKNASLCIENAHGQNIWNVHLQPWRNEEEFWQQYEGRYMMLLEKARVFLRGQTQRIRASQSHLKPKAAIFLSAGFDASEHESPGMQRHKVNVPTEFYARLARDVKKLAVEEDCSVDGRIISVLEGGYSDRALTSGVFSHLSGLAGSDPDATDEHIDASGYGMEAAQRLGALNPAAQYSDGSSLPAYDPSWWALRQLEILDQTVNPSAVPEQQKVRDGPPPAYYSSTQSFNAKVVDPTKTRRLSSGTHHGPSKPTRAPSPPPPEVGWATAARELSKVLVPDDRQTMSYRSEELSAEATRVRRGRQPSGTQLMPAATIPENVPSTRMSLRERKAKPSEKAAEEQKAAAAKISRRKTVTGAGPLASEKTAARTAPKRELSYKQPAKSTRRLSMLSDTESALTEAPSVISEESVMTEAPSALAYNDQGQRPALPRRAATSHAIRPDSSMSSRGPSNALPVRKTRAPASTRGAPAKPTTTKAAGNTADVDGLTDGMKKVKISLTTKAQRDARAAAAASADASPVSSTGPGELAAISAVPALTQQTAQEAAPEPMPAKPRTPQQGPTSNQRPSSSDNGQRPSPPTEHINRSVAARVQQLQAASNGPAPATSPPRLSRTSSSASASTVPSSQSHAFIPYQSEGATPDSESRDEKLWMEPNGAEPAGNASKKGLPVFSSTGYIPFGGEKKGEVDMWEVPESPEK